MPNPSHISNQSSVSARSFTSAVQPSESGDQDGILGIVLHALADLKAENLQVFDMRDLSNLTDWVILASGRSIRHQESIAEHIMLKVKEERRKNLADDVHGVPLSPFTHGGKVEGFGTEWVLLDVGDVLIHLQSPKMRALYDLEGLLTMDRETERPDLVSKN